MVLTRSYRRYALLVLTAVYCSSHIDRNIMGILLEPIKRDLGLSDTQLGFLSGFAFAIFYATLGMPIAMWADRGNRRNIIALAIATWSAMTALCGLAGNFWQLALARIGVGVGEAGSSPPSHSMIADLYPREERASAMAVYSLGISFGIMIGFLVGGWVAEWYGWRVAFFVVGLPGLALAALVRGTLIEPPRGHAEIRTASASERDAPAPATPPTAAFGHMWRTRTTRHVVLGMTLAAFVGYGAVIWTPAFLMRSHGLSPGEVGTLLSFGFGIGGGLGVFTGGKLADVLARRDPRWTLWLVAIGKCSMVPFVLAFYAIENTTLALALYLPGIFFSSFYLGPSMALVQSLSPLRSRAMASAILLFVVNLIGLGVGPQSVGLVSDLLRGPFGDDSLRYALLGVAVLNLWSAGHYALASRTLRDDLHAIEAP